MTVAAWIARIDRLVWGPGMLALLMGTPGGTWGGPCGACWAGRPAPGPGGPGMCLPSPP